MAPIQGLSSSLQAGFLGISRASSQFDTAAQKVVGSSLAGLDPDRVELSPEAKAHLGLEDGIVGMKQAGVAIRAAIGVVKAGDAQLEALISLL